MLFHAQSISTTAKIADTTLTPNTHKFLATLWLNSDILSEYEWYCNISRENKFATFAYYNISIDVSDTELCKCVLTVWRQFSQSAVDTAG